MPRFQIRALAFAALVVVMPGSALADGVDDLMRSIRADVLEMDDIGKARDELVQQNVNDMAAYDAIKSSYDTQMAEAQSMKAQWDAQVEKRYAAFDGMIDNWNHQCGVTYVGELDEAAYNTCASLKADLDPYVTQGRAAIEADDTQWYASVMGPEVKILERQADGMDDYAAKMKARFEQTNAMDDRLRVLRSHVVQQLSGLGEACKGATSIEAVKYCHAIDWDGARAGLPTIEEIAPIARLWPG
ncbi:MAG TPA: hypothetical protein VF138_02025 [Caulobacteraceae bacterium]